MEERALQTSRDHVSHLYGLFFQPLSLACGLPDNFQTWFSVTHLHVWLLMVRIRAEKNGKVFQQQLVNHFFHDIEDRMRYNHKVWSKGLSFSGS